MKRIGIYLGFPPEGGGAFQYAQSVLVAAAGLRAEGFEVVAAHAHAAWKPRIEALGGSVVSLPVRDGAIGVVARLLLRIGLPARLWRRLAPRLHPLVASLQASGCTAWIFPAQDYLTYAMPGRCIGVIHDLMHRYERRFPEVSSWGLYRRRERHYRNICDHCSTILVDSTLGRQHVIDAYGVSGGKIEVLPYAAPAYILDAKPSMQEIDALALPAKFIFYPAQFWRHKNHSALLNALRLAHASVPDLHLVLAGAGKNADVLGEARELGLASFVHSLGYVPDELMAGVYRRAEALVMPTYFGPTNIPPLEAMSVGCPVAISRIYAMPEQLGDAALYFDPGSPDEIANAILRIMLEPQTRAALVQRGYLRMQALSQAAFNRRFREAITRSLAPA